MDRKLIVLSGMPASGKDTITIHLCKMDDRFVPFKKYRSVTSKDIRKDTYYNISLESFKKKIEANDFLQYHERYGRYYGVASKMLHKYFEKNLIPIIHIGRIENFYILMNNLSSFEKEYGYKVRVIHIQLWETESNLKYRIIKRDKTNNEIDRRIRAMKQEYQDNIDMMDKEVKPFSIVIKNSDIDVTCKMILQYVDRETSEQTGYNEFWEYLKEYRREFFNV